jgi:hypothetical protein
MKKMMILVAGLLMLSGYLYARSYQQVSGTASVSDGSANSCAISTPSISGAIIFVTDAVVWVSTAAAGGGGEIALEDGVDGTRIFEMDADAVGTEYFHFEDPGLPITADVCLNLTVDGAITTQATGGASARGNLIR